MSTKWVIADAADRMALDQQKHGEIRFMVSNTTPRADPQRLVPASGSVAYLVRVAVPADAVPGSHAPPAWVHSADSAPDGGFVVSGRGQFDVARPAVGTPGPPVAGPAVAAWWLVGVAALVVLVLGVVVWLLASGGGAPSAASTAAPAHTSATTQSATATPAPATVPNLLGLTEQDAVTHQQKRGSSVYIVWGQAAPWVARWKVSTSKEFCYYLAHITRDRPCTGRSGVDPEFSLI